MPTRCIEVETLMEVTWIATGSCFEMMFCVCLKTRKGLTLKKPVLARICNVIPIRAIIRNMTYCMLFFCFDAGAFTFI